MKSFYFSFILLSFFAIVPDSRAADLYVSSRSDSPDALGTQKSPFTSLDQARGRIRTLRRKGNQDPWTVHVRPGFYTLTQPFVLTPEDSGTPQAPVIYRGEGKAEITGGEQISGWRALPNGIWEATLPITKNGKPAFFEMLYLNGRRLRRARHPNSGFFVPLAVRQEAVTNRLKKVGYQAYLTARDADLAQLGKIPPEECKYAQLVVHHNWDTTRRILLGFDVSSQTLLTQGNAWKPWNRWRNTSLYYVENVRTAFDQPGEWFYDGVNQKVLYRPLPGEKIETSQFVAPLSGLATVLMIKGEPEKGKFVSNIRFENLRFSYTDSPRRAFELQNANLPVEVAGDLNERGPTQFRPAQAAFGTASAVIADGAHEITFEHCEITHTGEYALWLRDGCVSNRIQQCLLTDLGAGGVKIGGSAKGFKREGAKEVHFHGPMSTAFNIVDNCIITKGGRFHTSGVGVWIGNSSDNQITHCEIYDHFYTGVSIGWVWGYSGSVAQRNTLAFNRIGKIGQGALGDMGGVYTLGTSFGTCVSNNVVFDVDSYTYGGWGLYTDEGSEGITWENNLVYNTKDGSFHQHYGRNNIIRNNILAYSRKCQVAATRAEKHRSFAFAHNIVYWDRGPTFKKVIKSKIDWVSNLWFRVSSPVDFNGKTLGQRQKEKMDIGSICADPLFVDPGKRDFRLQKNSPAAKIGFRPFDYTKAGVYGSAAWKKLAEER